MTKIKACGLTREREIDYVNQYLPDYAGFVLCFPRSRRSISPERAEQLIRLLNPGIGAVGVVVDLPLEQAIDLLSRGFLDVLQLHGSEDADYIRALKAATGRQVSCPSRSGGAAWEHRASQRSPSSWGGPQQRAMPRKFSPAARAPAKCSTGPCSGTLGVPTSWPAG